MRKILVIVLVVSAVFAATYDRTTVGSSVGSATTRRTGVQLVPEGLVAYFPFDGDAEDKTGLGHTGILIGTTAVANRFDEPRSALAFDGTDDYIRIPPLIATYDFSVSVWVKGPVRKKHALLYQGNREWCLRGGESDVLRFGVRLVDRYWYYAKSGRIASTWTHVVGTYEQGTSVKLYVNDVLVDEIRRLPNIPRDATEFHSSIGAVFGGVMDFFEGALDDVRLYSRALKPTEVHLLFREHRNLPAPR